MKADHILVVMNGKIVEQGSHDDLIHSKGKYHDLWSKQIFFKPISERARSRSPKKLDNAIINDLTPSRQKAELAKALKTTQHGHNDAENDDPKGSANGAKPEAKKKSEAETSHKREVSA